MNVRLTVVTKPKQPHGPAMTLGNMRELGVHRLVASCLNDSCRHTALIDVSSFPAGTEIPSFGAAWSAPSAPAEATKDRGAAKLERATDAAKPDRQSLALEDQTTPTRGANAKPQERHATVLWFTTPLKSLLFGVQRALTFASTGITSVDGRVEGRGGDAISAQGLWIVGPARHHPQGDANTACLPNPYSIRGFTTVCLAANSTIFGVVFGVSIEL
jgi:hypothetical protein